jgi:NADH-quinone oxidoreductase subunit N
VLVFLTAYVLAELGAYAAIALVSGPTGEDHLVAYRGLYRRAPVAAVALAVCMLSLFGVPGTAGFIGKYWLIVETHRAGYPGLVGLIVLGSVVSLATYGAVIRAIVRPPEEGWTPVRAPAAISIVLIAAMAGVLVLGIAPGPLLRWAQAAVQVFFAPGG